MAYQLSDYRHTKMNIKKFWNIVLFAIMLLSITSCDPIRSEVYYTYDDIVIRRTDQSGTTTLYYMKDGVVIDTTWVKYHGLTDSWFDSDMLFLEDKTVLICGDFWERKRMNPYMFKILETDYNSYFYTEVMNGAKYRHMSPELGEILDTLYNVNNHYRIVLSDPKTEFELFNKENQDTKVRYHLSMPE